MTTETLVTAQGKKQMCCETTIELNDEQFKKLTDDTLAKRVDDIIKDLHIDWAINVQSGKNILSVTRTTTGPIDDEYRHNLEIAATNFMSAVEELQCGKPTDEAECPSHIRRCGRSEEEENNKEEKRIQFVKNIFHDMTQPEKPEQEIIGADIVCMGLKYLPFPIRWGGMSGELLKEMCELYLAAHNK